MLKRLIKLTGSIIYYIYFFIKNNLKSFIGKKPPGILVVLYYHTVAKDQRKQFAKQMDSLCKWTQIIKLDSIDFLSKNQHYTAVTFDDGYQSMLENAVPDLIERKIPATIFITSGSIGGKPLWIHSKSHPYRNEQILTSRQINNIDLNLITIGSHCVTHPDLTKLTINQIKNEFIESKYTLEEITKKEINFISFPHGRYNHSVVQIAKEIGYNKAFSIDPESITRVNEKFLFGRINTEPTDWSIEFFLKIHGAYSWLTNIYKIKSNLLTFLTNITKHDNQ